jgi:hypothetical protein
VSRTLSKAQSPHAKNANKVERKAMPPRPTLATPAGVLQLQRAAGNTVVNRLIQRKLTVGAAHDPLEQEADRVAEQVISRSSIQRHPEEDQLQAKRVDPSTGSGQVISRAPQEEDELMTKREKMLSSFEAGSDFESKLSSSGGGKPLDTQTRSQMEAGIGADFSSVRVHTGSQASSLNRSISARAFTRGSDVFFDSDQYNPGSVAGNRLIAHELTHVVQQGGAPQAGSVQRKANAFIQRDFWDRFKKKKKGKDATPQTATWQRYRYRDDPNNQDKRMGAINISKTPAGDHRHMFNQFKWMEQAMSNNVDMTEDTESNYYMNQGRAKASANASDMDQFAFMQEQMSKAWWTLNGAKSPLWQHANESFRAPRQEQNNQFLSKANQQRWLGEKGMRMTGKQKVDPHDPFKTYKGADIFTAEANGDPHWDQHAGKRMAYVDEDILNPYEEVPESYSPGIDAEAVTIDIDDLLDMTGQNDTNEQEENEPAPEDTGKSDTAGKPPKDEAREKYAYNRANYANRAQVFKKKGLTTRGVGNWMNRNLNPVEMTRNLNLALKPLTRQTKSLDTWERLIRKNNHDAALSWMRRLKSIANQQPTPGKLIMISLMAPIQGNYAIHNWRRAKSLLQQHLAKWPGDASRAE